MSTSALDIRYGTEKDHVLLADFGRQAFIDAFGAYNTAEDLTAYLAGAFSPEIQAAELSDPDSIFLIAEISGRIAGFARLLNGHAPAFLQAEKPIELVRIYVAKDLTRNGIGSILLQRCLDEAAKHSCDLIWLGVWEHNKKALNFYTKWGFSEAGSQNFLLGSDLQTDLVLGRKVPS